MSAVFTVEDLEALSDFVADGWTNAADRDWSVPAGTLEWSCLHTADHAVDCVYAPVFFLASRRVDHYPVAGSDLRLGDDATPETLVESLRIATRILAALVRETDPSVRAVLFGGQPPTVGATADFPPRAAMELILHGHDVATGLGVAFEPDAALCRRLGEHTRDWPMWSYGWRDLGRSDDPWGDLLAASGRARDARHR